MFTNRLFKAIAVVALIVIVSVVTISLVPAPKSAIIPVTGNQNAYSQYLSGEKAYYSNAVESRDALLAWRAGEKFITHHDPVESALLQYRLGEKGIK